MDRSNEIRELEARFRLITEDLEDVFAETVEGGRFTYVSPNVERLLGIGSKELIGRFFHEFVHPADLEGMREALWTPGPVASGSVGFRIRAGDGHWRWVESRGLVYTAPSGEQRNIGMTRDVTEQREAAQRHALLEQRGRDLLIDLDANGVLHYVSPNHAPLLGHAPDTLESRNLLAMVHPDDRPRLEAFLATGDGQASVELRFRLRNDGAQWRLFEAHGNSYFGTDDEPRFLLLCSDVTEREAASAALAYSKARSEQLARRLEVVRERERAEIARDVHDELGQGLVGLRLVLSTIRAACSDDAARERLEQSEENVDRLADSLHRIVARLHPPTLDLGLGAAVEAVARDLAEAAGWDLKVDLAVDELKQDLAFDAAVFRIAQEALTNVARHADAEHVSVVLRVRGSELQMTIRDDGRGVPWQASQTNRLGIGGMHERALAWGGQLQVLGSPGRGTAVHLELPLDAGRSDDS
ncbi:MAG: PAS domain-containing sensor histidine kinase [Myxococcota bacterium]